MKLPADAQAILRALGARADLAPLRTSTNDDDRRKFARICAEQLRHALGDRWGTKRASQGRPYSKDGIAFLADGSHRITVQRGGTFSTVLGRDLYMWDFINGTTRAIEFHDSEPINDSSQAQVFVEVDPVDHLTDAPAEPTPQPGPTPQPSPIEMKIAALVAELAELRDRLEQLEGTAARVGQPIALTGTANTGRTLGHAHDVTIAVRGKL